MLADFHVHSAFSDDSDYSTEAIVKDAIRLNLDALCFTEHVDYGIKPDWNEAISCTFRGGKPLLNCNYKAYLKELDRLQEKYGAQITIHKGLELGAQTCTLSENKALMDSYWDSLDFVLLSIHQIDNKEFWTGDFPGQNVPDVLHKSYWDEMYALVKTFDYFDCLAHLDLIDRYDPHGVYPYEKEKDLIAEVLRTAITKEKAIEINTSGIRYGLGHFHPKQEILELYKDLGGKLITIGSDSHKATHLGSYLKAAQELLASLGFDAFYTYSSHAAQKHSLL